MLAGGIVCVVGCGTSRGAHAPSPTGVPPASPPLRAEALAPSEGGSGASPSAEDPYAAGVGARSLPLPPPLVERPTDGEDADPVALVPPPPLDAPGHGLPPVGSDGHPLGAEGGGAASRDDALPPEVAEVDGRRAWNVIVIHHSATAVGGAASFDRAHRAKGEAGIGYHFVIGNGTDTPDGALETTFRWREQRDGAHAKGWDAQSVGICLVGNFEDARPSPAQMRTLVLLVRHLRGRYGIPGERVLAHSAVNATKCPGARFSMRDLVAASDPGPGARGP